MIVSIHQPQYIPWIPYFSKIKQADVFVSLDDVQFEKNGLQNRNYILSKNGEQRLTMSVTYDFGDAINTVKIFDQRMIKKHWQTIEQNYRKAPYFDEVAQLLVPVYTKEYDTLCDLINELMACFIDYIGITTKILFSSELTKEGKKSDLVLSICKNLNATTYLTGAGALTYMNLDDFEAENIKVEQMSYNFKEYRQISSPEVFVPKLSILDLIFNEGKNSINFI